MPPTHYGLVVFFADYSKAIRRGETALKSNLSFVCLQSLAKQLTMSEKNLIDKFRSKNCKHRTLIHSQWLIPSLCTKRDPSLGNVQ